MNILITQSPLYETSPVEGASASAFLSEIEAVMADIDANGARISALQAEIERLRLIIEDDLKWLEALQLALE